jgi:outer membrane PBP1 activator LpoA protein
MLIRFLPIAIVIVTISACQSTPSRSPPPADLASTDAGALLAQAQLHAGTRKEIELRILAARVYLFQNQHAEAIEALVGLQTTGEQGDVLARLRAQAWFGVYHYQQAENEIAALSDWLPEDLLLLGEICQQLDKHQCSADAYIQAELAFPPGAEQLPADIHERIWLGLSRAQHGPAAFTHRDHHAWWLLQQQIRAAGSIVAQIEAWSSWRARYPNHPASLQPPQALEKLDAYRLPRVGVVLPLTGAYAAAGLAVRDGMVAAYLGEAGTDKPRVRFYDSGSNALGDLYETALSDGVDVLVGPLIKQDVEHFAALTTYSEVPRLVLNYLGDSDHEQSTPSPSLFQFGIAIEDETTALANHILANGPQRLMVVHSEARWSLRALTAFTEHWPYPVTRASFANIKELTQAIGEAMQVAASEQRKDEVARILGQSVEFLPRGRNDLDGVVALTSQVEAQALVPALRFHFADTLPVFATSQAAKGDALDDLAGFMMTDMPLFANPDPYQVLLGEAFDLQDNPLSELYALGFDAYRLATWLPILDPQSQVAVSGATGLLWLEPGGKFRRDLTVTQIGERGERVLVH